MVNIEVYFVIARQRRAEVFLRPGASLKIIPRSPHSLQRFLLFFPLPLPFTHRLRASTKAFILFILFDSVFDDWTPGKTGMRSESK